MVKKITFSKKASADIDRIVEFNNVRNRSDRYSQKFISNLNNRLQQLCKQPLSGMSTDIPGILILVWEEYYIFYKPNEDYLEISSIYHQKENISR